SMVARPADARTGHHPDDRTAPHRHARRPVARPVEVAMEGGCGSGPGLAPRAPTDGAGLLSAVGARSLWTGRVDRIDRGPAVAGLHLRGTRHRFGRVFDAVRRPAHPERIRSV